MILFVSNSHESPNFRREKKVLNGMFLLKLASYEPSNRNTIHYLYIFFLFLFLGEIWKKILFVVIFFFGESIIKTIIAPEPSDVHIILSIYV